MTYSVTGRKFSRRAFLKTTSAAIAAGKLADPVLFHPAKRKKRNRMILSFYMDDTNPYIVKADAFKFFLDYCNGYGVRGESSVIPGIGQKLLTDDPDDNEKIYQWQARQAWDKGIDSHMEIMTHGNLWDFGKGEKKEGGIHEGLWLHEPGVTMEAYRDYFGSVINTAALAGIKFTGLTWPGCGCEACTRRYAELKLEGPLHISQAAFDALLSLTREKKFRSRVLPVFYESSETDFGIFRRAADGPYGVYDLQPNCGDHFGIWENSREHVDPDYYITADGTSGIILQHYKNNAPYCMWYMHWQGANPENGKGWKAFQTVVERIKKHLPEEVIWMRPSDIVTAYHDAGGWSFSDRL